MVLRSPHMKKTAIPLVKISLHTGTIRFPSANPTICSREDQKRGLRPLELTDSQPVDTALHCYPKFVSERNSLITKSCIAVV